MAIHNPPTRDVLLQMDEGEVYNDIYEKFSFHRLPSPNYKWVQHGHLLAGYDAWYYSYVWYALFPSHGVTGLVTNNSCNILSVHTSLLPTCFRRHLPRTLVLEKLGRSSAARSLNMVAVGMSWKCCESIWGGAIRVWIPSWIL